MSKGCVLLFTGLSGSGKTAIADHLLCKLQNRNNGIVHVSRLDGDIGRKTYSKNLGFSGEDRVKNNERAASVASYVESKGNIILASYIAPSKESRQAWRDLCENLIIIYVRCPLEICEMRDPKGLYKKARAGQIKSFTGIHSDAPFISPRCPDLILRTDVESIEQSVNKVLDFLEEKDRILYDN